MKSSQLLLIAVPHLVAGSLLYWKRDVPQVVADFKTIETQAQKVKTEVDGFTGGVGGIVPALGIQGDANTLDTDVKQTTTDAQALGQLNDADSATIANTVTELQSTIFGSLDSLVAKHDEFETVPLAIPLVQQSLITLRNDTAILGTTVTSKLSAKLAKVAPLLTGNIDFHFARAVQAYGS